jgi:hypothetical protein
MRFRTGTSYATRGLTMDASFTTPQPCSRSFFTQIRIRDLAMSWRPRQPLCPLSTLTTRPCAARTIPNISIDTTRARRRLLACTGVGATEYPLPPRQACASSSRVARRGRHGGRRPPMTARAPPRDWRAVDGTPRCMMRPAGAGRPHDHSHPCAHGPLDLCGFRPRSSW